MVNEQKIQELQILEQRLQHTLLQKQSFQMELAETNSASEELEKSGDEVFKIIGQLMIKSDKRNMQEELTNKKKILELKLKSFEKQEELLSNQLEKLQKEITEN